MTRWFPGVLQSIVEEVKSKSNVSKTLTGVGGGNRGSVRDLLAKEATKTLESKRNKQIAATKEKSLSEIKQDMGIPLEGEATPPAEAGVASAVTGTAGALPPNPTTTRRRVRQKMRSTPVVGGSLFDDHKTSAPEDPKVHGVAEGGREGVMNRPFASGLGGAVGRTRGGWPREP